MVGIDLSFVYEYVPIDIKGDTAFERLMSYKKTRLEQDLNAGSIDTLRDYQSKALNTKGLEVIAGMYQNCVAALKADSSKLTCDRAEIGDVVTIRFNVDPKQSLGVKTPSVLKTSTVSNATLNRTPPSTAAVPPVTVIPPFKIPPGGRGLTLYRVSSD